MEIDVKTPEFKGNMLEYEGGMMYFPDGIDSFCRKHSIELVEIREDGSVWCLRNNHSRWEEYPFDVPVGLTRVK